MRFTATTCYPGTFEFTRLASNGDVWQAIECSEHKECVVVRHGPAAAKLDDPELALHIPAEMAEWIGEILADVRPGK